MSINVTNLYEPLNVSEHIPAALRRGLNGGASAASVVQQRITGIRYLPVNGTSFSYSSTGGSASSSIISFKLTDSMNYLDLQSCHINITASVVDASTGYTVDASAVANGLQYTVPDDASPIGMWTRGRISVNSVVVEDINNLNQLTNALMYANCDQSVYNNILGNEIGAWKHNTEIDPVDYKRRRLAVGPMYCNSAATPLNFSIPLCLLFPFFQTPVWFPLRSAGTLQVDLYLDQLKNFMLPALLTTGSTTEFTLNIQNINISCDMLQLDPVFCAASDKLIASEDGFKMPISTFLVAKAGYPIGTNHITKNLIFNKATPLLRSMVFWNEIPTWVNNPGRYSITSFPRLEQGHANKSQGTQIKYNSSLYPINPMITVQEHFRELNKQVNGGFSCLASSLINPKMYHNYNGYGSQFGAYNATGLPYVGDDVDQAGFIWAMSFDKLGGTDDQVTIDGIDTSASGVITVQFSNAIDGAITDTQVNLCAGIQHTRFLILANNQAQMIGM